MSNFFLSIAYAALAALVIGLEKNYHKKSDFDSFVLFLFFYLVYILLPGIVIHGVLSLNPDERTGVSFFDSVYQKMDPLQTWIVFLLNVVFLVGFYLLRFRCGGGRAGRVEKIYEIKIRSKVLFVWLAVGVLVCGSFFIGLGDSFADRYAKLILFRNLYDVTDRDSFTANAFSITMTFSWLCAGLVFYYAVKKQWGRVAIALGLTIFFSLLMGSRRGFIFPIIIIYLSVLLCYRKTFWVRLLVLLPIVVAWISIGKELTGSFAYDVGSERVFDMYSSFAAGLLRAFSDIGIGQIQSIAVFQHFDFSPRFGIDHLLSALRRIPDGMIGLDIDWPERITRITTEKFLSADAADIPPGLIGASWLDFPVVGAFAWGVGLALQIALVEHLRLRAKLSPAAVVVVVLLVTIVAMPLNTGSYDFTFSVDIILLLFVVVTSFKLARHRAQARQPEKVGAHLGQEQVV